MKIVLISVHDGASDRKTGFHFWADILSRRGNDVRFVTVGSSMISLLKKNGKQLKKPFNTWVELAPRFLKYTWLPPFHPLYAGRGIIDRLTRPLFSLYPHLLPQSLGSEFKSADIFIVENGAGQMLVPLIAKLNPSALILFNSCDRPSVIKLHSVVVDSEKSMLPHLDAIRLNAAAMAADFPAGTETHYIPQAIDKALFDSAAINPYKTAKNAINVGDMIFDAAAVEILADHYTDWTFHLFGKGAKLSKPMDNVVEHGEVPFLDLVPYIKFADIGLSPYRNTEKAAYLGQSSLKNVQYTYCRLPIVAPAIAGGSRPHIITYTSSDDPSSVIDAFGAAISYDRNGIDPDSVPSWEDVIDRMIALAEEGRIKRNGISRAA